MRDRSAVWIGTVDLCLAVLAVVIVAVNPPAKAKPGVEMKAEILATVEWSVDIDADVDIHMMPPKGKPVFYQSRDVGCATLDRDNRGFLDSVITLADGSTTKVESDKETIAIRCVEPGAYDLAANLYADHRSAHEPIKVHVEIVGLNPQVHVIYAHDIMLTRPGETINWASFEMARDGSITLTDPPLTPLTDRYQRPTP